MLPGPVATRSAIVVHRVSSHAKPSGVVAGAPCLPSMNANRRQEMGFRLLVTPSDAALLRSAAEQASADIGSERPTDRDLSVPTLGY